jgi:hypothetical protein
MSEVAETIAVRDARYGGFGNVAATDYDLKAVMHSKPGWARLTPSMKCSLDMIMHKMARIIEGDPNYADNWHDIAGYATLIDTALGDAP